MLLSIRNASIFSCGMYPTSLAKISFNLGVQLSGVGFARGCTHWPSQRSRRREAKPVLGSKSASRSSPLVWQTDNTSAHEE